jgi:hypothetical protein
MRFVILSWHDRIDRELHGGRSDEGYPDTSFRPVHLVLVAEEVD